MKSKSKKNVSFVDVFAKEKAFAKVTSKQGYHKFINDVMASVKGSGVDVPEHMVNDFGVNKLSEEYHLVYFAAGRTIHCADKEFFDFVYKTETPFIQSSNKILWFEV